MYEGLEGGVCEGLEGGVCEGLEGGVYEGLEGGVCEGLEGGVYEGLEGGVLLSNWSKFCLAEVITIFICNISRDLSDSMSSP